MTWRRRNHDREWSWHDDTGREILVLDIWSDDTRATVWVYGWHGVREDGPTVDGAFKRTAERMAVAGGWRHVSVALAHISAALDAWPYAYAAHRLRALADRTYARFTATLQAEIDTRDGTGGMRAALRQQEHADRLFARWGRVERLANACAALAGGEP